MQSQTAFLRFISSTSKCGSPPSKTDHATDGTIPPQRKTEIIVKFKWQSFFSSFAECWVLMTICVLKQVTQSACLCLCLCPLIFIACHYLNPDVLCTRSGSVSSARPYRDNKIPVATAPVSLSNPTLWIAEGVRDTDREREEREGERDYVSSLRIRACLIEALLAEWVWSFYLSPSSIFWFPSSLCVIPLSFFHLPC